MSYAEKLEKQTGAVPKIRLKYQRAEMEGESSLSMGWALKSSQTKKTRFNDKQKQYLTQIFNLGQTTGHKANAADVAKSMMTTKDYQGERMFSKEKFRQLDRSKAFSPV